MNGPSSTKEKPKNLETVLCIAENQHYINSTTVIQLFALLESFVERRPLVKTSMRWSVFLYLRRKRNRNFKIPITNIVKVLKVSVAGTSLEESEKNFYKSLCKKNNSLRKLKKAEIVSSEHIANATGHRGMDIP